AAAHEIFPHLFLSVPPPFTTTRLPPNLHENVSPLSFEPSTTRDEETNQPMRKQSQPSTTSDEWKQVSRRHTDEETKSTVPPPDEEQVNRPPPQMKKQVNRPPRQMKKQTTPDEETSQPSAIPYAETSQPSTTPDEETSQPSTTPVEETGKSSSSNTVKYTIPPVLTQNASRDATASSSTTAKCPTVVYLPILPRIHNNTEATTSNTLSWVVNSQMCI
ncbi:hypothetical protein Ocin01_17196, partial [Orchesella cincta]